MRYSNIRFVEKYKQNYLRFDHQILDELRIFRENELNH